MKILLLTIQRITTISTKGIYSDLMRKFRAEGHDVYIITPLERIFKQKTELVDIDGVSILRVKTLNIRQTNSIEKGLATILIAYQFLKAVRKYFPGIRFDLILYSTPPITFTKVIRYFKRKDKSVTYLLLRDIFPQNAIDLGLFRNNSILHRYFRRKERGLYAVSDHIGCMSPANVDYLRKQNPQIDPDKIEVNPNCREPVELLPDKEQLRTIREKYKIPQEVTVFIYGGNLGKPQGIDFLLDVLYSHKDRDDIFFIIAGSGTEYLKIKTWFEKYRPGNALLLTLLPTGEYDVLVQACDAGMIFLNRCFTIPNFPSRLLSYLECKLPVIAATDKNTDLGRIIEENNFGLWSEAGDLGAINRNIAKLSGDAALRNEMGSKGYEFMLKNYSVSNSYNIIMQHFK